MKKILLALGFVIGLSLLQADVCAQLGVRGSVVQSKADLDNIKASDHYEGDAGYVKPREVEKVIPVEGFRNTFVTMYKDDSDVVKTLKANLSLRIVKKGDFLFALPLDVYGFENALELLFTGEKRPVVVKQKKADYYLRNGMVADSLGVAVFHDWFTHTYRNSFKAIIDFCCQDFTREQRDMLLNNSVEKDPELKGIFKPYVSVFLERLRCYVLMENQDLFAAIKKAEMLDKKNNKK